MKLTTAFSFAATMFLATCAFAAAPQFSGTWVNSSPLKTEGLKGKVVVLYYYEEGCPSCRAKWPGHIATSEQFKDQPVVFIAVNSGNEPSKVASYLAAVNCNWPALADVDRSFEKASNVGVISLQNIYQARIITPAGNMVAADFNNLGASVQSHLSSAKWKVDPAIVPESMKAAWKAFEFGDYGPASAMVKRTINSKDEKTKTAAEALDKAITEDLEAVLAAAETAEKAGDKWAAYKAYNQAAATFKGHPKATLATEAVKRLATESSLKDEIRAMGMLDRAEKALASRSRNDQRAGESMLDAIVKQFPETEAGIAAEKMVKSRAQ